MQNQAQTAAPIDINEWLQLETHQEAVEMMKDSHVVPFGTSLWP